MKIEIDTGAGVCPGVARAIRIAEEKLAQQDSVVSVGPLIHNPIEISRLEKNGLQTFPQTEFESAENLAGKFSDKMLLVRAHGISPKLQEKIRKNGLQILDATCPKVTRIQRLIHKYSVAGFQVVIVGKAEHPEVLGLAGSAVGKVFIVLKQEALEKIPPAGKTLLVAQTTTNQENFEKIAHALKLRIPELVVKNTICSAVSKRHAHLQEFARRCDVVLFVGGHHSSNTRELFLLCQQANSRSFRIEKSTEIDFQWFEGAQTVGVSGSASTPIWQLKKIAAFLTEYFQNGFSKINIKEELLNG